MRGIPLVFTAAVMVAAVPSLTTPVLAQSYCQCVCSYDHYGRRHCRQVCSQPRYVPPASLQYTPRQQYYQPPFQGAGIDLDPALVGLAVLAAIIAVVVFLAGAFNTTTASEIAQIAESTHSVRAEADDAARGTHAIHSHIASAEADAFEQGRRAADEEADEEWKEFTRHD